MSELDLSFDVAAADDGCRIVELFCKDDSVILAAQLSIDMGHVVENSQDFIVELLYEGQFIIRGLCKFGVLRGKVSCLGYEMTSSMDSLVRLASPYSHSFLTLSMESDESDLNMQLLSNLMPADEVNEVQNIIENCSHSIVFIVQNHQCKISRYIQTFHRDFIMKEVATNNNGRKRHEYQGRTFSLSSGVQDNSNIKSIVISDQWKDACDQVLGQPSANPIILVCGSVNVGKSTFVKYFINSYLSRRKPDEKNGLWYVDLDPGQSEFVAPGCVSYQFITQPVFGPSYMHMSKAARELFVGGISVGQHPHLYINAIEELSESLVNSQHPIIINTIGWVKNLGLNLLIDIICILRPTHVIQLMPEVLFESATQINSQFVASSAGWLYTPSLQPKHNFHTIAIQSNNSLNRPSSLYTGRVIRNMCIIAYFGQLQTSFNFSPINYFKPLRCSWSKVLVHLSTSCVPNEHLLTALNGCLVSLCFAPSHKIDTSNVEMCENGLNILKESIVCERLALGIIRAIDEQNKSFYVITPLSVTEMQKVNLIVLSNIEVPHRLLTSQKCCGSVAYVVQSRKSSSVVDSLVPNKLLRKTIRAKR